MNITNFNEQQRQAILDLMVLAMYADGFLASVEDARVQQVLTAMGVESDYERNRQFDAAVARVRRDAETKDGARTCAAQLAASFTTAEERGHVVKVLNDLMTSDSSVSPQETSFQAVIRQAFETPGGV